MFSKILHMPQCTAVDVGCGWERAVGIDVSHEMLVHAVATLCTVARAAADWVAIEQAA
jgi:hypothetical protein